MAFDAGFAVSTIDDRLRDYQPPDILIWSALLHQIELAMPRFRQSASCLKIRTFPDGSLYVAGKDGVLRMHEILRPCRAAVRIRENTQFRPLSCFGLTPTQYYALMTTAAYFENIGDEEDFCVYPTPGTPTEVRPKMPGDDELVGLSYLYSDAPPPGEKNPERLLVRVRFWGGLDKGARPAFYKSMIAWADSVGTEGIFGEGPAYLYPESFLFNRRWAIFQIDVSQSGQHTVNWLTLSILNFAALGDYVSLIRFGDAEDAEEW